MIGCILSTAGCAGATGENPGSSPNTAPSFAQTSPSAGPSESVASGDMSTEATEAAEVTGPAEATQAEQTGGTRTSTASSDGKTTQKADTTEKSAAGTTAGKTTAAVSGNTTKTTTTAKPSTASTTAKPADAAAKTLGNTYARLTKDKKLTIGYIGGSVTVGTGSSNGATMSWRALTTAWFKSQYPNANIREVNAALGGMGSLYGASSAQKSLLTPDLPDLVFVEFAINDSYQGYTGDQSARYMESLVRTLYNANPYMDIVFVYTTDTGKKGGSTPWTQAFEQVAKHYGILSVDVGARLLQEYGSSSDIWNPGGTMFSDSAHPKDAGYAKYAAYIQEFLTAQLAKGGSWIKQEVPGALRDDLLKNPNMYKPEDIQAANNGKGRIANSSFLMTGDAIEVTFSGTKVGMVWIAGSNNPVYIQIDGGEKQLLTVMNPDGTQALLFDDLTPGRHTFTVTNPNKVYLQIQRILYAD